MSANAQRSSLLALNTSENIENSLCSTLLSTSPSKDSSSALHLVVESPPQLGTPISTQHHNAQLFGNNLSGSTADAAAVARMGGTSPLYSWSDVYEEETDSQTRKRWLKSKSFGRVLESEGGASCSSTTPYAMREPPKDVWSQLHQHHERAETMHPQQEYYSAPHPGNYRVKARMIRRVDLNSEQITRPPQPVSRGLFALDDSCSQGLRQQHWYNSRECTPALPRVTRDTTTSLTASAPSHDLPCPAAPMLSPRMTMHAVAGGRNTTTNTAATAAVAFKSKEGPISSIEATSGSDHEYDGFTAPARSASPKQRALGRQLRPIYED